jgi:branched-subunit amino acid aminotransferase/4-amino-4-deoxychorismate lyase
MTPVLDRKETALMLARRKGLLRTGEAAAAGVDRSTLARLCEHGLLERLERGLDRLGIRRPLEQLGQRRVHFDLLPDQRLDHRVELRRVRGRRDDPRGGLRQA